MCLFPPLGALGSHTGHQPWQHHTPLSAGPSHQPPLLPFQIPDAEHMPFVTAPSYSPGAPVLTARPLSTSLAETQTFRHYPNNYSSNPAQDATQYPGIISFPTDATEAYRGPGTHYRSQGTQMKTKGPWRCTGFSSLYGEHE